MRGSEYLLLKNQSFNSTRLEITVKGLRKKKKQRKRKGVEGYQLNKKYKRGHITPF